MKKRIIIFSSLGGGGHTAVTKALTHYLHNDFEIISKNIFSEVIACYEPFNILSCGVTNAEKLYNKLITKKYYRFLSFFYLFGNAYFKFFKNKVAKKIEVFLRDAQADLVISDVPLVNGAVLEAAKKINLPFLLIPTDLDIKTFVQNIYAPTYKNYLIALPFADAESDQRLIQAKIPLDHSRITGFVLRPDFFETKDIQTIKQHYQVPPNKPVVLVMLGAMGLDAVVNLTQELVKTKHPVHLIICLGKREDLKETIRNIALEDHVTITILGFTDRISDLMAIADLCVTKSGSVSFCEAIYMNLPVILDATLTPLAWEKANHRFVIRYNFGQLLKKYADLPIMVDNLLANPEKLNVYKKNLMALPKKHGGTEIKHLIKQMLNF